MASPGENFCGEFSLGLYRMNETDNESDESFARFFSATGWLLPVVAKLRAVPTPLRRGLCQKHGIYTEKYLKAALSKPSL